ncbi:hypothetical protein [Levilactobacillus tujiorum]|uniref:ABC transporter permease n=1 Tax=Levilactobacillus tujiorum TaxID=2912243 RepID=A0ABX1L6E9_9LACO|nr:hypothetical protein [Levilactobacillus tujiorum]MCH5465533.1 hypothetical protein [Levilactobacillus tujiorum]NLR12731.1 hypothetical protein [Lactobacillus sp. HBUAS51387]NLR30646.1 hypothetical protein [Levilactobacillus tujiorum]
MPNYKIALLKGVILSQLLALFLFALIRYTGINPLGDVDALQTFWGTLLSETYNFYKIIPMITVFFVLWIKRPNVYYSFFKLNKSSQIIGYYYLQLVGFVLIVLIAWIQVMVVLVRMVPINPENVTYGLILAGNYLLNMIVLCSFLLVVTIRTNKVWTVVLTQLFLYVDQWLNIHWGQSLIFYHGLMLRSLPQGSNLSDVIYDYVWNVFLIIILLIVSWLFPNRTRFFRD